MFHMLRNFHTSLHTLEYLLPNSLTNSQKYSAKGKTKLACVAIISFAVATADYSRVAYCCVENEQIRDILLKAGSVESWSMGPICFDLRFIANLTIRIIPLSVFLCWPIRAASCTLFLISLCVLCSSHRASICVYGFPYAYVGFYIFSFFFV